jgi:hypothetical protein
MSNFLVTALKNILKQPAPEFPPELDCAVYCNLYPDLAGKTEQQLLEHYTSLGRTQGRPANAIASRDDFAGLIPGAWRALEIGPFAHPMLRGVNVAYCDALTYDELERRATKLGLDTENIPRIDYVLGPHGLDSIPDDFRAVLSSHNIEHQPDLVRHLQQAQRRIERLDGRLFLIIPDKRFCFDRFIAESTIAQVLEAHESARSVHTLRSVVEHRVLTTHNDSLKHWQERQMQRPQVDPAKLKAAIAEWREAQGGYIDVHAWYFTPDSFPEIIDALRALGLIRLQVERLYPTRFGANEFWVILNLSAEP